MPLTVGTRLGPYEIVAPIGAGGMGEVYRAHDVRLARDVAVKVLPPRFAEDPVTLARFEREARAVAALSHPNIMAIFDMGSEGGLSYAVTELLEGDTLRQHMQEGALAPRKAIEYATQVAQGLAAAHEKGIVHRDLKPENVFLMPDGRVKILDFGLARQADEGSPAEPDSPTVVVLTGAGVIAGTPAYMAPEQVRGQSLTPQVDIFAFGSMLFEMLTGQRAFKGQTPPEIMTAVLKEDPPDILTLAPAVPAPLAALVRHCLEKQPGERFQSARDLAFNLQVLAGATTTPAPMRGMAADIPDATSSAATALTSSQPAADEVARRPRHVVAWALAVGLPLALAGGLAAGRFLQAPERPTPHFTRASFTPKAIFRAAFAPERGTLVYSAATNGNESEILLLTGEYPSARPIGLRATHLLAISSKGELALLTRARLVGPELLEGTLARMPIGSIVPRELLDGVRDADWLPDGDAMVVVRTKDGRDRVEWPGTSATYGTDGYLTDLHVSPKGDRVVFVDHPDEWEDRGSLVVLERGGRTAVLAGPFPFARGVAWQADGGEVLFSASLSGTDMTAIYSVTLGGTLTPRLEGSGNLTIHDVAPTGEWLVTRDDRRTGLRALGSGAAAELELSWLDRSRVAALGDDGKSVLFTERAAPAGPTGSVCLRATSGTPPVSLGPGDARDLSPDGRLALAITAAPPRLVVYPAGAGSNQVLPAGPIVSYRSARWFPDGRRVLVCGTEKGTGSRCYVQDLEGGAPRAVTGAASSGLVSPDGQKIMVWSAERIAEIYALSGGPGAAVPTLTAEDVPVRWTADGRGVIVYQPHRIPCDVELVDLGSGRREVVRQIAMTERTGVLSIDALRMTADHASYAYTYSRLLSTLFTVK